MRFFNHQEWTEKYNPLKNPNIDIGSFSGTLYQNYGADLNNVLLYEAEKAWSLKSIPGLGEVILSGIHAYSNGYFLTENAWKDEENDDDLVVVLITEEARIGK